MENEVFEGGENDYEDADLTVTRDLEYSFFAGIGFLMLVVFPSIYGRTVSKRVWNVSLSILMKFL